MNNNPKFTLSLILTLLLFVNHWVNANICLSYSITTISSVNSSRDSTICDIITLTDGSKLNVKVLVIKENEIEFKYCDNLKGPTSKIPKKSIAEIKYPNGTFDKFSELKPGANRIIVPPPAQTTEKKYVERKTVPPPPPPIPEKPAEGFGLLSFLMLIIGYVTLFAKSPWSLLFLMAGVVFGFLSWFKITNSKGKFGQVGWAYAAIIFGILGVLAMLLLVGI